MRELTPKQRRFCEEYLIDLNATQAAIRAGYAPGNASDIGGQLLKKSRVRACIDAAIATRSRRTGINQDRVIRELARVALANPLDVIDAADATVRSGASDDDTAVIQSMRVKLSKDGHVMEREIRLADKLKALELLGKHLGMFVDKHELTGRDGAPALRIVIDRPGEASGG